MELHSAPSVGYHAVDPMPAPIEAGSIWRAEKIRDFRFRVRALRMENDPQVQQILREMSESTVALENMKQVGKRRNVGMKLIEGLCRLKSKVYVLEGWNRCLQL